MKIIIIITMSTQRLQVKIWDKSKNLESVIFFSLNYSMILWFHQLKWEIFAVKSFKSEQKRTAECVKAKMGIEKSDTLRLILIWLPWESVHTVQSLQISAGAYSGITNSITLLVL